MRSLVDRVMLQLHFEGVESGRAASIVRVTLEVLATEFDSDEQFEIIDSARKRVRERALKTSTGSRAS